MISRRRRLKNIDLAYFITFFPLPFFLSLLEKFPMKWAKIVKNALFPHSSSDLLTCPAPAITFPFIPPLIFPPPQFSTPPSSTRRGSSALRHLMQRSYLKQRAIRVSPPLEEGQGWW